jgi:hypothetical protein
MSAWLGGVVCFSVGLLTGLVLSRPPAPFYGLVEKDIPLDTLGASFPAGGVIKKGTVVTTGNVAKGGNIPFEIGGWVSKDRIRLLGDYEDVQTFLKSKSTEHPQ